MVSRLKNMTILALAALAFGQGEALNAQEGAQGRFRVLIPNFQALQDADDGFGKDVAKELRELINALPTHQPVDEKEIKQALKQFKLKMEDLDCIRTRQLASQINAQLALCATYTEPQDKEFVLNAEFWGIETGESFQVDEVAVADREEERAAQHIFSQFDEYIQQIRFAAFCADYARSQQWDNALENCDNALELNPNAVGTRFQRGRILFDAGRLEESLVELERVLELNPVHDDGLQLAGYVAAKLGRDDEARAYYGQYLELNPGDASVRMKIAYDLATAGDPVGAMQFIQVGLDVDGENTALWEQYGNFAFTAAAQIVEEAGPENGGGVPPQAAEFYREAIGAYDRVFAHPEGELKVGQLRNSIAAHIQLEELDIAVAKGEEYVAAHPEEVMLHLILSDAHQRRGDIPAALAALDRVLEIDPAHPTAKLRKGQVLIQAGRINEVGPLLREAVAGDPQQALQAARLIFNDAYANGYQKDRWQYAITGFTVAKQLPDVPADMVAQLNFWHGFSLYRLAMQEQEPQTLQTAQTSLAKFQEAVRLFERSGNYPASVNVNVDQLLGNANTYIEIQEAIIKRGR